MLETKLLNFAVITDPCGNPDFLREAILTLPEKEFKNSRRSKNPVKIEKLDAIFVLGDITGMVLDKETKYPVKVPFSKDHVGKIETTEDEVVREARAYYEMEFQSDPERYRSMGILDIPEIIHHYKHHGYKDKRWREWGLYIPEFERLIGLKERGTWISRGEAYDRIAFGYGKIKEYFEKSKNAPVYASADTVFFEQMFPEQYWLHHAQLLLGGLLVKALNTSNPQEIPDEYLISHLRRGEKELPLEDWDLLQGHILLMYDMPLSMHRQLQASKDKLIIVGRRTEFDDSKIGQPDEEYPGNLHFCEDPGVVSFYSLQGDLGVRVRYVWDGEKFERKVEEPINLREMRAKASTVKRKRTQRDAEVELAVLANRVSVWKQMEVDLAKHPHPRRSGKELNGPLPFLDYVYDLEGKIGGAQTLGAVVTGETEKTVMATLRALGLYEWYEKTKRETYDAKGITDPNMYTIEDQVKLFDLAMQKLVEHSQLLHRTSTTLQTGYNLALHGLAKALRQALGISDKEVDKEYKKFQDKQGLPLDQPLDEKHTLLYFEQVITPLIEENAKLIAERAKNLQSELNKTDKDLETALKENKNSSDEIEKLKKQKKETEKTKEEFEQRVSDLETSVNNLREECVKLPFEMLKEFYGFYHNIPAAQPCALEVSFLQRLASKIDPDAVRYSDFSFVEEAEKLNLTVDEFKAKLKSRNLTAEQFQFETWLERVRQNENIAIIFEMVTGKQPLDEPLETDMVFKLYELFETTKAVCLDEVMEFGNALINAYQANENRAKQVVEQRKEWLAERAQMEDRLVQLRTTNRQLNESAQNLEKEVLETKDVLQDLLLRSGKKEAEYKNEIKDKDAVIARKDAEYNAMQNGLIAKQAEDRESHAKKVSEYETRIRGYEKDIAEHKKTLADSMEQYEKHCKNLEAEVRREKEEIRKRESALISDRQEFDAKVEKIYEVTKRVVFEADQAKTKYEKMFVAADKAQRTYINAHKLMTEHNLYLQQQMKDKQDELDGLKQQVDAAKKGQRT